MPHPHVPLWLTCLFGLMSVFPGIILWLFSVLFLLGLIRALLTDQQMLFQFMMIGLFLAFVWWLYMQLPGFLRRWISKLLGRGGGGDEHGH